MHRLIALYPDGRLRWSGSLGLTGYVGFDGPVIGANRRLYMSMRDSFWNDTRVQIYESSGVGGLSQALIMSNRQQRISVAHDGKLLLSTVDLHGDIT